MFINPFLPDCPGGRDGLIFIYQVRHNFVPCLAKLCCNVSHIYMKLCRMRHNFVIEC